MTNKEIEEYYNNATDEERREMEQGCGIGCIDNAIAIIGCALFLIVVLTFIFLSVFGVYDDSGNFIKWSWQN